MSLFIEPKTIQQDSHMVMTNVYKPEKIKHINIDTQFHDEYHSTTSSDLTANFNITLPERINDVKSLSVTNIEIPVSFYTISKNLGNNHFQIDTTTFTVPDGNYTSSELIAAINALSPGVTFSASNYKTSISAAAGKTIYFQNVSGNVSGLQDKYFAKSKLGWLLGFRKLSYDLTSEITGESILNMNGPKYLYLALEEFNKNTQNSFTSPLSSSLVNKNIIARISLNNSSFGTILNANIQNGLLISDKRKYHGKNDLQKLNVQLLTELGKPINLNGLDFSFCLEATYE